MSDGNARSRLDDKDARAERKKRQHARAATDGRPNGVVHVLGDVDRHGEDELRNIIKNVEGRDPDTVVLDVSRDADGLHVETEDEKLAQHIADAIGRSRNAEVERVFVDATKTRVLTLRLP